MTIRLQLNGYCRLEHITTNDMKRRAGLIAPRHRHPVFHLIYITEGRGSFVINEEPSEAEPGMLYIINPNEWHQFSGDESAPMSDLECTFLLLDENAAPVEAHIFDMVRQNRNEELPAHFRSKPFRISRQLEPFLMEGFQRILESDRSLFTNAHREVMVADLLLRVEEVVVRAGGLRSHDSDNSADDVMARIKQFMAWNIASPVMLADLASFVHLTPNYLCRVFKEQTGQTPMAYLMSIRMIEAEKLLIHTDLPIYAISEKVGYDDPSYFARAFRKYAGMSPQTYRNLFIS